jgi:hypothetical protein
MLAPQRRRLLARKAARPASRRAGRSVTRSVLRSTCRSAVRRVLPATGPTLNQICKLGEAYLRLATKYDKKWHPPNRFKTLITDEEAKLQEENDLRRAYGKDSPFVRNHVSPEKPAAAAIPPPPVPPPAPPRLKPKPGPPPDDKHDITQVPLRILPSGFLGCDWDAVRPPKKK